MNGFLLSSILLQFQGAAEHYAVALVALLEPSWYVFARLAFVLLLLHMLFNPQALLEHLILGLLWIGATHVILIQGWEWTYEISHGVRRVSNYLGVPAYDPDAIIGLGAYVADPLLKGTANGGLFSYMWNPASIPFLLAGLAVLLAFCILAFAQFVLLLLNYLLIASSPFMLLWLLVPGLSAISHTWIRLACGNLSALFVTGLIAGIMNDLSEAMADHYRAVFLNATTSLTWVNLAEPLCTAIILASSFAWIPLRFSREASAIASGLLAGASMVISGAVSSVSMPSKAKDGGNSLLGKDGQKKQIPAQNSGGMNSFGPAQAPKQSAWSKP